MARRCGQGRRVARWRKIRTNCGLERLYLAFDAPGSARFGRSEHPEDSTARLCGRRWLVVLTGGAQLAAVGERRILQGADGADERGALRLPARWQLTCLGPPRQLPMRGKLQHRDLIVGEAVRRLVAHLGSRTLNSISRSSPQRSWGGCRRPTMRWRPRRGSSTTIAIGDSLSAMRPRSRSTMTHQRDQLGAQRGIHALRKPRQDVAALVSRQAEAIAVAADRDLHAGAYQPPTAIRAPPGVTLLGHHPHTSLSLVRIVQSTPTGI